MSWATTPFRPMTSNSHPHQRRALQHRPTGRGAIAFHRCAAGGALGAPGRGAGATGLSAQAALLQRDAGDAALLGPQARAATGRHEERPSRAVSARAAELVLWQQGQTREAERHAVLNWPGHATQVAAGRGAAGRCLCGTLAGQPGADMVLVGSQALAFWMSRFDIDADRVAISNDGDALGSGRARTQLAASRFRRASNCPRLPAARPSLPSCACPARAAACATSTCCTSSTPSLARASRPSSREGSSRTASRSSGVRPRDRVMEPFDVLESRAQNAVGLFEDKGPHVVTQARWAVLVAREGAVAPGAGQCLHRPHWAPSCSASTRWHAARLANACWRSAVSSCWRLSMATPSCPWRPHTPANLRRSSDPRPTPRMNRCLLTHMQHRIQQLALQISRSALLR